MATDTGAAPTSQSQGATLDSEGNPVQGAPRQPGKDPKLSEREALMAKIDAQIVASRVEDDKKFFASADVDPRAAALAADMAREARGEQTVAERVRAGDPTAAVIEDADSGAGDAAEATAREAVRISNKGTDPLGEYVVRVEGKPMFKTLVDGKEVLVPLDRARAQLQKHLAADIRLQQVSERQKQLDAREQSIRTVEATLKTRSAHPSATAPVLDDQSLDTEAVELVRSLVSEPEGKAAARLAKTLKSIRASQPQVDVGSIVKQASDEAVRTIAARDNDKALGDGFSQFTKDYPDIAGDSDLFALADRKTTAIAEENPTWTPGQVMLEAGKQTREWMKNLGVPVKGATPADAPNNRQQRKQNLVPMPQPRSVRPAPTEAEEGEQTPLNALAEIRKSRGQAY
jgi:hypothetical protein